MASFFSAKAESQSAGISRVSGRQRESRTTLTSGSDTIEELEVAVATSVKDDVELAVVDCDGNGEVASVPIGIDTAGFLAKAAVIGGKQAAADDFPGVEIRNPVLVNTVAIVDDVLACGVEVSTGIHMETADFLGVDSGVERSHVQSGSPHTHSISR